MISYYWQRYSDDNIIKTGWLFARNLCEAKHLVVIDAAIEKTEWVDRKKCSIMPISGNDYIVLEQKDLPRIW